LNVWSDDLGGFLGGPGFLGAVAPKATPHASASATRKQQHASCRAMPPRRAIATAVELAVEGFLGQVFEVLFNSIVYCFGWFW
jgi:hypothetical protein